VAEVANEPGVSDVTIYACRNRFGKLEAVDVKRLRQTESENENLKKLLAEQDLEIGDEGDRSKKSPRLLMPGRSVACLCVEERLLFVIRGPGVRFRIQLVRTHAFFLKP